MRPYHFNCILSETSLSSQILSRYTEPDGGHWSDMAGGMAGVQHSSRGAEVRERGGWGPVTKSRLGQIQPASMESQLACSIHIPNRTRLLSSKQGSSGQTVCLRWSPTIPSSPQGNDLHLNTAPIMARHKGEAMQIARWKFTCNACPAGLIHWFY